MEPSPAPPGGDGDEGPSSYSSSAAAATATSDAAPAPSSLSSPQQQPPSAPHHQQLSRYESQKRRDWNTFLQYLKNHKPPLALARCSGAHVIEFLKYLDQFGKTKVHAEGCAHFGDPNPPAACACPLRQAWGSLDALIGRLRAAYEENGGRPESNSFGAKAVRIYLREVRESQAKARGIPYEKKKRKRRPSSAAATVAVATPAGGGGEGSSGGGRESSSAPTVPADAGAGTSSAAVDSGDGCGAGRSAAGEDTDAPATAGCSASGS